MDLSGVSVIVRGLRLLNIQNQTQQWQLELGNILYASVLRFFGEKGGQVPFPIIYHQAVLLVV